MRIAGSINYETISSRALRPIDFALIVLGYISATGIAALLSRWDIFRYPSPEEWAALPLTLVPVALILWSLVSGYEKVYSPPAGGELSYDLRRIVKTLGLWGVLTLGTMFLIKSKYNSRQFVIEFIVCASGMIILRQLVIAAVLRRLYRSGYNQKTVLVLGSQENCERFILQANHSQPNRYNFVGVLESSTAPAVEESQGLSRLTGVDEIFVVGPSIAQDAADNIVGRFLREGKSVHIVPQLIDASLFRKTLGEIGSIPVLSLSCGRLTWVEDIVKRAFDLVAALVLLMLSTPLWVIAAALIRITSPGPIFFRQKRLGKDGISFTLLKFRTMHQDAERLLRNSPELYKLYLENNYKIPAGEDPRITPLGRLLRSLSVDELPQLINVVKGEMSLVGPRPILPAEIDKYGEFAPLFLSVKPGLTGHWQVSGRSEIQEYDDRVQLDLQYIRDQSIRTDLEILLRTVPTVLRRRGAY
jgi:exopolysaccharide production protein ExoY